MKAEAISSSGEYGKNLQQNVIPYPFFFANIVGRAGKIIVVLNHIRNRIPIYAIRNNFYNKNGKS